MNKTNKYSWLTFIPVGIACFYFYLHTCPYHLLHKEQTTLFVYASEVLYSYLNKPAVLSCLTGDYLTQFFRTPVTASILMGGIMLVLGLICYAAFRKWTNGWLAIIPAITIMSWEMMRSCGLLYPLSSTISLIGGGCLFLLYDPIKNRYLRIGAVFFGIVLGYWLFGYGVFIFLIFVLISSLIHKRNRLWNCLAAIMTIVLPGICSKSYLLTYSQASQYPATSWWDTPNSLYERLIGLDIEAEAGHWDKVRELSFPEEHISACSYYYNLANAVENKLPDRLMYYYQPGTEGLFIPISSSSSYLSSLYANEVWFHLGDMTMAEHATILGMIFSPNHTGSRMVKRLAEINLINRDEEAAMKYLRILSKTKFYSQWAKDRIPGKESDSVKRWLKEKRAFIPKTDTIRISTTDVVKSLRLLLASNPKNEMARDYLLCLHLLAKNLPAFIEDYPKQPGKAPKRLYAEALMIDLVRHHASGKEIQETIIDPTVVQDFKEYTRLHRQSKGDPQALTGKFGKTYWYYYHFAQNQ